MSQSSTLAKALSEIAELPLPPAAKSVSLETGAQLRQWLLSEANDKGLSYLIGHADDGVIWGKFEQNSLKTADEVTFSTSQKVNLPTLRLLTLQQCRVFGSAGETLLWQGSGGWRSRHISAEWEQPYLKSHNCLTEKQLLWGTHGKQQAGFTLLRDGSQGLKHAVPVTDEVIIKPADKGELLEPLRLIVRHYIDYESDGIARIFLSRLVKFISQK
ncbi:MAG: CRISPR-associated protein Csx19 [Cyanobacteria bacterium J06634_6]